MTNTGPWRAFNKQRHHRFPPSPLQGHLGDVIGEPLPPMRAPRKRRYDGPRWIETMTGTVVGYVAIIVYAVLILAFVAMLFQIPRWPPL